MLFVDGTVALLYFALLCCCWFGAWLMFHILLCGCTMYVCYCSTNCFIQMDWFDYSICKLSLVDVS